MNARSLIIGVLGVHRALLLGLAFIAALLLPAQAFAASGSYSIDELSTEINVETNGAAHIIERQVCTFDDRCEGCVWYLHVPEDGESVRIASVRVAPADDGGTPIGDWTRLQAIDVNRRQQGEAPGDKAIPSLRRAGIQPWYSYSIGDGMIRCYFPTDEDTTIDPQDDGARTASTETSATNSYLIEVDYTIAHRVRVYRDVAELYWRYANSSLPVDAHDVNLHVTLPVPDDAGEIMPGETIVAWGHGPNDGSFEIGADGSVSYHLDDIKHGEYAEAHIIFPAYWVSGVGAQDANVFVSMRRDAAVSEESDWVDAGTRGERWDNRVRIVFLCIIVVVVIACVVSVMRYGRTPRLRRALIRAAATLGIVMLGASLFFHEPLTTGALACAAAIIGAVALFLPTEVEDDTAPSERDGEILQEDGSSETLHS